MASSAINDDVKFLELLFSRRNVLVAIRDHLGSLDPISGVIKLLGLVNSTPELSRHPFIIDGASEVLPSVFGSSGTHARSAFGVASLPNQITVEIEAIFELKDDQ